MTVVNLAEAKAKREPHVAGEAFCIGCDHIWTGVWPLGTTDLECPNCKRKTGRSTFEVSPQPGAMAFTCNCGNQLFHCLEDRIHCPSCGQQTDYSGLVR